MISFKARLEPINPAPPVIKILFPIVLSQNYLDLLKCHYEIIKYKPVSYRVRFAAVLVKSSKIYKHTAVSRIDVHHWTILVIIEDKNKLGYF